MPTRAIAGFRGKLYAVVAANRTAIAEITEATLNVEQEEIEATSFDSGGWVENVGGMKSWSVDAEANLVPGETTQTDLFDALVSGETVTIELYPNDGPSAEGYSGSAIVTSFEVGVPTDDKVTLSLSLTGTGALTSVTKPVA